MEMNTPTQMSSSAPPPDVTAKKKRGRPRKDRSLDPVRSVYVPHIRDQNLNQNHREGAPAPPGFEGINGSQQPQQSQPQPQLQAQPQAQPQPPPTPSADKVENNSKVDSVIGLVVTGAVEAVFDAGYLISVRVGDSNTSLRGVVFKPGHYVPVSSENDVAPSLQMIRRTEVPLPTGNQGKKRRGREKSDHQSSYLSNDSPTSNQFAKVRATQMSIVPVSPHPVGERGTVVPVLLQPVNLANGATPAVEVSPIASQPAHLAASKSKQPPLTQDAANKGPQADIASASQPLDEHVIVATKMKGPCEDAETHNDSRNSGELSLNNPRLTPEQVQDLSQPLLVKPLQAIRSGPSDQHASLPHSFANRTGKMTELLMAVQENLMERQMGDGRHQEFKSPDSQ